MKVLYVDESELHTQRFKNEINDLNIELDTASSIYDIPIKTKDFEPDLVVLDFYCDTRCSIAFEFLKKKQILTVVVTSAGISQVQDEIKKFEGNRYKEIEILPKDGGLSIISYIKKEFPMFCLMYRSMIMG